MKYSWRTTIPAETPAADAEPLRVLVLSIDCTDDASRTPMLAPAFLVAHARTSPVVRSKVEFDIEQFSALEPVEGMIERILEKDYDLIGFSCYVWNYEVCAQLIPILKRLRPRAKLVMGGPQILGQEMAILDRFPELDFLVYRDGEVPFAEIVERMALGNNDWLAVGGILFREGSGVHDTLPKKLPVKFADIASPYLEGVITGRHRNLYLETYRGCPYTCAFCAWGGDEGPKSDLLPLDRIRRELELMRNMGADMLGFFDSNFNQPPSRAEAIFDMILDIPQFQIIGMSIFAQTLREELAIKMSQRRTMIGVGLQSSDPGVNAVMRRRFRDHKMNEGLRLLKKYAKQFVIQIIVGLPGDSYQSIASTLECALSFEPPAIDAFRLMVLPGTEYRQRADEFQLVYEPNGYHYVISHYTMTLQQINRAERMAQALTVFYNLEETRQEMFRQAAESGESIVSYCDAIGTFIEDFSLLDRNELRKGDIIRTKEKSQLLKILQDFSRFRAELSVHLARESVIGRREANQYTYIPVLQDAPPASE